jgi:hypothetical protein
MNPEEAPNDDIDASKQTNGRTAVFSLICCTKPVAQMTTWEV